MIFEKELSALQLDIARDLSKSLGLGMLTCEILVKRGIDDIDKARAYLSKDKYEFYPPQTLFGMDKAVEKISSAVNSGKKILVFGDYDADGICATAILYYTFKKMGVSITTYIPEREFGYGISQSALKAVLALAPDLIITVDLGIGCHDEIEQIKSAGIDVVVTDHHELPEVLPDCVTVNCKIPSEYPYTNLCGAGTAYKLAKALIGDRADELLDFVAVATIADSMTLDGENRYLVKEGLKLINSNPRPQFRALIGDNKSNEITSSTISYNVAPKINAAGRMGDVSSAVQLMLTQDKSEITRLADKLCEYNRLRQTECDVLYAQAKEQLEKQGLNRSVIVLADKRWSRGLVGIISARLCEEYTRPVILFSEEDGRLKGSARSLESINIFKVLTECKKYIYAFGGHSQAAGVTVEKDKFGDFINAVDEYVSENYFSEFVKKTEVDKILTKRLSVEEVQELRVLEPFGTGNRKPVFAYSCKYPSITKLASNHLSIRTDVIDLIYFGGEKYSQKLSSFFAKTFVFEIGINSYKGIDRVQGTVKFFENVADGYETKLKLFKEYLNDVRQNNIAKSTVQFDQALKRPYGTLFCLNSPYALKDYPMLANYKQDLFCPSDDDFLNRIVYSLKDKKNYSNVIYIDSDKPFGLFPTGRQDIIPVFNKIREGEFYSSTDLALKCKDLNAYTAIFAVEVLKELGIVSQNQFLKVNVGVKRDLSESPLFKAFNGEK